jgi:hypothetical protein
MGFVSALIAAVFSFLLGGPWYSQALFGGVWNQANGLNPKKKAEMKGGHPAAVFGASYALSVVSALILSYFLGPSPTLAHCVRISLLFGVSVACCFGINYSFADRGVKMFLVDAGYHIAQYLIFGIVLAVSPV